MSSVQYVVIVIVFSNDIASIQYLEEEKWYCFQIMSACSYSVVMDSSSSSIFQVVIVTSLSDSKELIHFSERTLWIRDATSGPLAGWVAALRERLKNFTALTILLK